MVLNELSIADLMAVKEFLLKEESGRRICASYDLLSDKGFIAMLEADKIKSKISIIEIELHNRIKTIEELK